MRAVIQRVIDAKVTVDKKIVGKINKGLLVLFGCHRDDTDGKLDYLVDKLIDMRIFADKDDKMNLSLKDIKGEILVVSQFTLLADIKKGRRPSFINSMEPKKAEELYEKFISKLKQHITNVQTGIFGAKMLISLINDGPVTFILDI